MNSTFADKWVDLNVTDSTIAGNSGRGIAVDNLRSRLNILRTSVSYSGHVAGVHVNNGAGHVNITDSRIAFNSGYGVNVTYAGGSVNISRTSVSSNFGDGIAVWFNDTKMEYVNFNQTVVLEYSEVFKNIERGILVGNFCREAYVNITGNWFNLSMDSAVEVLSCWKPESKLQKLYIGHNTFVQSKKLGIKIRPVVNMNALIEFNKFRENHYGCLLLKNDPVENLYELPAEVLVRNNEFYHNKGVYVVNLGLSPYSDNQALLFTWNFVKNNKIIEPFDSEFRFIY